MLSCSLQVTQLGHVKDLATAFHKCLGNPKAKDQIFNISGQRFVTFDGIAKACAKAAGGELCDCQCLAPGCCKHCLVLTEGPQLPAWQHYL